MEKFPFSDGHGIYIKTYNPTIKYTFVWKIENYSKIPLEAIEKSPVFSVERQSTWYAELEKRKEDFIFKLHRNCDILPVELVYTFTVADIDGKECYMTRSEWPVDSTEISKNLAFGSSYTWANTLNSVSKAKNDSLNFMVLLEVRRTRVTEIFSCSGVHDVSDEVLQQNLLKTLSGDLKNILVCHIKKDLVLRVQNQKLDVHQVVLSARSPVFAKMLEQEGMTETKDRVINIDDITMPVLSELVAFLYSGEMKDYDFQTAMDLYYTADKYEVLELRGVCARVLVSKMTLENAPKVLTLADLHQDAKLKDNVLQFIKTRYKTNKDSS